MFSKYMEDDANFPYNVKLPDSLNLPINQVITGDNMGMTLFIVLILKVEHKSNWRLCQSFMLGPILLIKIKNQKFYIKKYILK